MEICQVISQLVKKCNWGELNYHSCDFRLVPPYVAMVQGDTVGDEAVRKLLDFPSPKPSNGPLPRTLCVDTNPANFLDRFFWPASGLPTIHT